MIFKVSRIGMATHIYYLSVGEGELAGHLGRCQECKTAIPIDASKFVRFEKDLPNNLDALIQNTYPDFHRDFENRLEIEDRLKSREPMAIPNRERLLMEPFDILAMDVEERFAYTPIDREIAIAIGVTSVIFMLLCCGSAAFLEDDFVRDVINLGLGFVFIAGVVYTFVQIARAPKRYIRRMIVPRLSQSLRPLSPIRSEIADCIERIKSKGLRLGKHIDEEQLWETIQHR